MDAFIRLQEQAYNYLKEMIANRKLEPGIVYSETKISQEIGISRTPVRDALQRLNQDGYIDILPSKGFMLHKMTLNDVLETYQTRCAIEGYCTLLVTKEIATKRAQQWILQLKELIGQMEQSFSATIDLNRFSDIDQRFHSTIVEYAKNESFNALFRQYMYRIHTIAIKSLEVPGRPQIAMQEHISILSAMEKGDTRNIYEITMQHMESPKRIIINKFFD